MSQPATPVLSNFKEVLQRLASVNSSMGNVGNMDGSIGRLNQSVIRLGSINDNLKQMLKRISDELNNMKTSNIAASKSRLEQYVSRISTSLNEIEKLIPIERTGTSSSSVSPQRPTTGGYQYMKTKTLSKRKNIITRSKKTSKRRSKKTSKRR